MLYSSLGGGGCIEFYSNYVIRCHLFYFAACAKGHYKLVGMILGWSLVHGGPGVTSLATLYLMPLHMELALGMLMLTTFQTQQCLKV
jgi:hypothetical protein